MTSVKHNGVALQYAAEELKYNEYIVREAAKNCGVTFLYEHVPEVRAIIEMLRL